METSNDWTSDVVPDNSELHYFVELVKQEVISIKQLVEDSKEKQYSNAALSEKKTDLRLNYFMESLNQIKAEQRAFITMRDEISHLVVTT